MNKNNTDKVKQILKNQIKDLSLFAYLCNIIHKYANIINKKTSRIQGTT